MWKKVKGLEKVKNKYTYVYIFQYKTTEKQKDISSVLIDDKLLVLYLIYSITRFDNYVSIIIFTINNSYEKYL